MSDRCESVRPFDVPAQCEQPEHHRGPHRERLGTEVWRDAQTHSIHDCPSAGHLPCDQHRASTEQPKPMTSFQRQIAQTQARTKRAHEQSARRIPTEVLRAELDRRGEPCEACGILLAPCGRHS